ncbi:recombinase family protein [Blautia sp. MSJ-9]|uniref:recombinase family protein n=1 Tax=Blautia sp. MSJ-9 TaxID=2841511 RepID=UPI001C100928|nr:recombinase family protein [Blautia sp. MSJ-9]MBU5679596.1 recombinase family protein [Blautia sp. MSJ-9]
MYQVGIYCRVSVEEQNKEGEYSNSIHSQIQMAQDYIAEQNDVTEVKVYADDGFSGSNFDRPEFRRMIADIELGNINMVIFKDISRLGREHIDTNYYLGKYFPEKQIRVVSLLDSYDSIVSTYDELLEIKTLLNDMYLRDISNKIKTTVQAQRRMGEYTPKQPPFGYIKSETVYNHLEVDPYAAGVVKRIYNMYKYGFGCGIICRTLNEDQIPCPAKYKKEVLKNNYPWDVGKGLWTRATVGKILKNPLYTGAVVMKKIEKPSYKLKYKRSIPLEEMELVPDAHEAIISKEEFDLVQQLRQGRRVPYFDKSKEPHKYAGLLFCGKCKTAMRKRYLTSQDRFTGYMCGFHQMMGKNYCEVNYIAFEKLDELVVFAINQQLKQMRMDFKKLENQIEKIKPELDSKVARLQAKIDRNTEYRKQTYEKFMDEVLSKEEFLELKQMYENEIQQYQSELTELKHEEQSRQETVNKTKTWLNNFNRKKLTVKQLTRDVLMELIDKIYVYPDQKIDIHFKFASEEHLSDPMV